MGLLTLHQGDLFSAAVPALAHGVNVRGVMGAGIATEFRARFPEMYAEYRGLCRDGGLVAGEVHPWRDPASGCWVYNLASQDKPGANARLEWLDSSVRAMANHASRHGVAKVAMPRVGCGIGGLRWRDVHRVLSGIARDHEHVELEVWTL